MKLIFLLGFITNLLCLVMFWFVPSFVLSNILISVWGCYSVLTLGLLYISNISKEAKNVEK